MALEGTFLESAAPNCSSSGQAVSRRHQATTFQWLLSIVHKPQMLNSFSMYRETLLAKVKTQSFVDYWLLAFSWNDVEAAESSQIIVMIERSMHLQYVHTIRISYSYLKWLTSRWETVILRSNQMMLHKLDENEMKDKSNFCWVCVRHMKALVGESILYWCSIDDVFPALLLVNVRPF